MRVRWGIWDGVRREWCRVKNKIRVFPSAMKAQIALERGRAEGHYGTRHTIATVLSGYRR